MARQGKKGPSPSRMGRKLILLKELPGILTQMESSLGEEWPSFRAHLFDLVRRLGAAEDEAEAFALVDEILGACLESPAQAEVRELLDWAGEQVQRKQGQRARPRPRGRGGEGPRGLRPEPRGFGFPPDAAREMGDDGGRGVDNGYSRMYRRQPDRPQPPRPGTGTGASVTKGQLLAAGRKLASELALRGATTNEDGAGAGEVHVGARGEPEPRREGAAAETAAEPRYLNTLFTQGDERLPVPSGQALIHDQAYALHVDISAERKGLGEDDVPFPDSALGEVWNDEPSLPLDVTVASRDFSVAPQASILDLPRSGPSEGVRFEVIPLLAEGRGYLQVDLLYRGQLLQSKQIEALIVPASDAPAPDSQRPVQMARITFTTTDCLDPHALVEMPERTLTVNMEIDRRDGSVDFRFLDRTQSDQELAYYDTRLQPDGLGGAIESVRGQLNLAVTGEEVEGRRIEGYQWTLDGDDALLDAWLPRLASVGRTLYRAILPQSGGQPPDEDQGERLRAVLKPGAVIQLNSVHGLVTIPWALLYERRIKRIEGRTRVCDAWVGCGPDCADCPYTEDAYVVCPYAFWGYRYAIEQVPCWVTPEMGRFPSLMRQISNGSPLYLNLNVWERFRFWEQHLSKVREAGQVEILLAKRIPEMETIWDQHGQDLDVVYFYSHGGMDEMKSPYLELSDGRIDSNFLEASELAWSHGPLVFLNGCSTGDYGPESYASLIDDFRAAGASAVVGTECPVPELFAEAYASELFPGLFRGESLGKTMLAVRLDLLRNRKNPMGLVYTLYAAHEIALARPVARD